jgi:glycosyltransferase involved in cell wall biosynthesis
VQLLPELNEGGVERGVVELSRELVSRGVESIVISGGGKQAGQIAMDGGRHLCLDVVSKNVLSAPVRVRRLRRLLQELKPDILHARSRVPAWLTHMANRNLKLPFVTTVHGFNSVNGYSRVMTFGDRVICVSSAIKEYIQHNYQVPEDKCVVIPRGVDLELFNPEHLDRSFIDGFKLKYALAGRKVVTAVGRITQLKDYETFIRGMVAAREQNPALCGLIVGGVRQDKQKYHQALLRLVQDLDAGGYIYFTGSQSCMAEIYSLSDVVVSCSRKPESFGRTAAEALAMNIPVIATGHGGVVDIVKDSASGHLIPVADSHALADSIVDLLDRSFSGLRARVESEFSIDRMVSMTLNVYQDLLLSQKSKIAGG